MTEHGTTVSSLFECVGCGEILDVTASLTTTPDTTLTGLAVASKTCRCGQVNNTVMRFGPDDADGQQ